MHENEVRNKFRKLVQQLISNTENGKIVWHDTADEDAFRANMQGGMVRVQKRFRFDEEGHEVIDYSLTLLDRKGRELEDYSPESLAPENDLADLWNWARRSSRGSVDVLDNLLKETALEDH
ncbi:MAG TPA: hypothetical protein VN688_19720 [Gemmataceae bacterium]|nr:hypothetical protein [Gemmataceae bacterium]